MADEFKHKSAGAILTGGEDDAVGRHLFDNQATGDLLYASSINQLSRRAIGNTGDLLGVVGGVPSWTTLLSSFMALLTTGVHVIWVPVMSAADLAAGGGWTAVTAGVGGAATIVANTLRVLVNSDIGSALWHQAIRGLGLGLAAGYIDWDKELYFQFQLLRTVAGAGAADIQGYVQLKSKNTIGALDDEGIGIRIGKGDATGLTIQGESWESALGEADFNAALVSSDYVTIGIHHRPAVSVDFYRDGVLQTNIITGGTKVPAGTSLVCTIVVSLETTDDPNAIPKLEVCNFFIVQAH